MKLGVLASHQGSNLQAIIDACNAGVLDSTVAIVISNNSKAHALTRAAEAGIPTCHLSSTTHPNPIELDQAILHSLTSHGVDLVVTAGYLKKLGPSTLEHFRNRIINIHPSLLPKHGGEGMYGARIHEAVLTAGESETGITIHHVDAHYDTGKVIAQKQIPVLPTDDASSLATRVLKHEHQFLIETLQQLTE